jgi:hypothetical protein
MLRSNTAGRAIRREDLTMGTTKILKGRAITHGKVTGEAIVSKSAFGFYGAVDPGTGVVTDKRHELYGKNIAGKVLVFPRGEGLDRRCDRDPGTGTMWNRSCCHGQSGLRAHFGDRGYPGGEVL